MVRHEQEPAYPDAHVDCTHSPRKGKARSDPWDQFWPHWPRWFPRLLLGQPTEKAVLRSGESSTSRRRRWEDVASALRHLRLSHRRRAWSVSEPTGSSPLVLAIGVNVLAIRFLTEVAAWFSGQTSDRLGPPQPLRGPQPSSGAALEDSKLCGDISSRAANSRELETMEQRITGKEQSTIRHPALSWIPFGFVKMSDVLQSWVHQTSPASAQSPAQRHRTQQTALGTSHQQRGHSQTRALRGETTFHPSHPLPHSHPLRLGLWWRAGTRARKPAALRTCSYLTVRRKLKRPYFYYSPQCDNLPWSPVCFYLLGNVHGLPQMLPPTAGPWWAWGEQNLPGNMQSFRRDMRS